MAQGSPIISIEHLKTITISSDFEGGNDNPYISRFWKAVEQFNEEEKKMLLRFITSLSRLPNPSINQNFKIKIDHMNSKKPDETLPTASTCFNQLHLPNYSSVEIAYNKILYAIRFCQTMENR